MRYFHESHCRLNFFVVNRCYFSDVLQHSNAKTMTSTRGQNVHLVASLFNSSSRLSIPRVTRQLVVEKLFISSRRSLILAFPCSLCHLSTRRVARQLVESPVNSSSRPSTRRVTRQLVVSHFVPRRVERPHDELKGDMMSRRVEVVHDKMT